VVERPERPEPKKRAGLSSIDFVDHNRVDFALVVEAIQCEQLAGGEGYFRFEYWSREFSECNNFIALPR
jgi:hypothetical protein